MPDTFVISCREVKKGKFKPEPGPIRYLRVPASADNIRPTHESRSTRTWRNGLIARSRKELDPLSGSDGDILIFVHGYNNSTDVVLWRTRQLQSTMKAAGWSGTVVAFDWPSDNSTLNYLEDRGDAAKVAIHLARESITLLADAQFPEDGSEPCKLNVHLLGHSTGAYVIMEAFASADKEGDLFKTPWRIGQVAFIGGDVASNSLAEDSDWAKPMYHRIMRLTNYSSGFDRALAISNAKRLGTAARAGRVGLPAKTPQKAVNVDCSDYFLTKNPEASEFRGSFTHSWHIGDPVFTLDLAMTLEGGIDRKVVPTRKSTPQGLTLIPDNAARPAFQHLWDRDSPNPD